MHKINEQQILFTYFCFIKSAAAKKTPFFSKIDVLEMIDNSSQNMGHLIYRSYDLNKQTILIVKFKRQKFVSR